MLSWPVVEWKYIYSSTALDFTYYIFPFYATLCLIHYILEYNTVFFSPLHFNNISY